MLLLALMLFVVGLLQRVAANHHACCAIECGLDAQACLQREQEHAREHAQREERTGKGARAAFASSAIALWAAGGLLFGRRAAVT